MRETMRTPPGPATASSTRAVIGAHCTTSAEGADPLAAASSTAAITSSSVRAAARTARSPAAVRVSSHAVPGRSQSVMTTVSAVMRGML